MVTLAARRRAANSDLSGKQARIKLMRKVFLYSVTYPDRYDVDDSFVRDEGMGQRRWTQQEVETIQALIDKDVHANVARKLVATKGPAVCSYYLRALPLQKWVKDPPAFLVAYIGEERPLSIEPPRGPSKKPALVEKGRERRTEAEKRREGYEWLFDD